ncbi:5930_t:CDS:2, partial [Funneliformis geosporum]
MSLDNIANIVQSLSEEPDKLDEDEEVDLYFFLTGNETMLAEVDNLCNRLPTNSAKLKYLRRLSKKSKSESETSRNKIQNDGLVRYWNAIKALEIDQENQKDLFLRLPVDVHILGISDRPSTLLIRNCYRDLADVVINDEVRRIRVTGNPGIGKTYFGFYLLYLFARNGRSIIYESITSKFSYVFDGEEAFLTSNDTIQYSYQSRRDVLYIVDGMEPKEVEAKTILVCSPRKSHYSNFDKYPLAIIRYMPEWTLNEIHTCRSEMFSDIEEEKANRLFSMWGGIPRFILEQTDDERGHQIKLINAIEVCGDKIFDYIGGHDASPEISHCLIHLWTNLPTEEKAITTNGSVDVEVTYIEEIPYTQQLYYFASNYVATLVTEKYKQKLMGKLFRDIEVSLLTGTSDQFLGTCFEQIAHRILRGGGKFQVRSLEPDCQNENNLFQPFAKQENILIFSKIEDIEDQKYYQPEIKNFPTIDALCAPDVLLQMTTSMTHPIKMVGLNKLYDKLTKDTEISFYFVVPAQLYDRYQKQGFITTKEDNARRLSTWIRQHVKQYALRIDLNGFSRTNLLPSLPAIGLSSVRGSSSAG